MKVNSLAARPAGGLEDAQLHLLGPWALDRDGQRVDLPPAGQRVLALLALHGGTAHRLRLACTLWPDQTEERALSNLRSTIWRLPAEARDLVQRHGNAMGLATWVWVDLDAASSLARALLGDREPSVLPGADQRDLLHRDLLPQEDDEWLTLPREQHRQLRLHALESLAVADLQDGRAFDAVDTALAAVAAEPLRESAQYLVVRAHLEAGNRADALEHFERFRRLLATDLGVEPNGELVALVARAVRAAADL